MRIDTHGHSDTEEARISVHSPVSRSTAQTSFWALLHMGFIRISRLLIESPTIAFQPASSRPASDRSCGRGDRRGL